MSAPLPNALRARFQRRIEEGLSGRAEVAPQGRPKGKGKLDPYLKHFWINLMHIRQP
jgi:hypothetical protein